MLSGPLKKLDEIAGSPQRTIPQIWLMAQSDDTADLEKLIQQYKRDMTRALPHSTNFLSIQGSYFLAQFELLYKTGRYEEAKQLVNKRFNPKRPWTAGAVFRLGDTVKAGQMMQEVSVIDLALNWPIMEIFLTDAEKDSPFAEKIRNRLGYTDAWRLELCRRVDLFPPESGIRCNNKP